MVEGWGPATPRETGQLRRLTAALGDALGVDDVAHATLTHALTIPGVVRVGLALTHSGGRELRFVAADQEGPVPAHLIWCLIDAFADVPVVAAVRGGEDIYLQTPAELADRFPEIAGRQHELGTRSIATLPLATDEDRAGALYLCYGSERYFGSQDRWFLRSFAAQVTQAVRRGVAYSQQSSTSEQLQRSLMPRALPDVDGLALGAHYQPGGLNVDVGGDWYDVVELADGSVLLAVGDVMGKGLAAAVVMSEVRSALRAYALIDPRPAVVLDRLDALVTALAVPEQIVTLVYGVVSRDRRTVSYAMAGHPPPLLVPLSGRPSLLDGDVDAALGLGVGPWREFQVALEPDESLLLYSDGLVANRDVELSDGIERLVEQVADLPARRRHPRELCARVSTLMRHHDAHDDVTVLAMSATGDARSRSANLDLPGDATAPRQARRFVRATLESWSIDADTVSTAELCVSELVTNAVIHAGTPPALVIRSDGDLLTVVVQDRGAHGTVQQVEDYDPMTVSGRGLTLVDALTAAWSAERSSDGTSVWFELELNHAAAGTG